MDGYPTLCLNAEKATSLFDKVYKLYYDNTGSYVSSDTNILINMFSGGQSVFYITWLDNAFKTFRSLVGSKSRTFASYYAKNESPLQTNLDKLIEIYKELE